MCGRIELSSDRNAGRTTAERSLFCGEEARSRIREWQPSGFVNAHMRSFTATLWILTLEIHENRGLAKNHSASRRKIARGKPPNVAIDAGEVTFQVTCPAA
jgi:hypothetical protein